MAKTYAQIIADASSLVQDGGNSIFTVPELDSLMPAALSRISQAKPWQYKLTKTTTANSRDLTLSTGDKWRLAGIEKLEYLVDQNPRIFRNFTRFGDVISIVIDSRPSSAVSIYLFMNKVHLLQKVLTTTDTAGKVKTAGAVGDVTLAVKDLGTATIEEMTTVAITGDSTVYYVISTATIASTEATLSIWPPLAAICLVDAVVTLSLTASTLDKVDNYLTLEDCLARWLAAKGAISKATLYYSQVNTAITALGLAVTAISNVAAMITKAVTGTDSDAVVGRAQAALGATAITLALTEFGKIDAATVGPLVVAASALVSGASLINTIPVGGGAAEYMGQASTDIGLAQGYMLSGQAQLQEASADNANAAQYFNAAAVQLRAAGEKANEAIANLRLVATRLQVSQGGLRYEEWGRLELAQVEQELRAMAGYAYSTRYPRD